MSDTLNNHLLEYLLKTAKDAGDVLMNIYNSDFEIKKKYDGSPVTIADTKAEAIIREALLKETPSIPFIGEEAHAAGHRPNIREKQFWLVDALDGTKEFIRKGPEFTVNISLIEKNNPIIGVIHAPAKNLTYWGTGSSAYLESNGTRSLISARKPKRHNLIAVSSHSHRKGESKYLEKFEINKILYTSSSLKFCLLASGQADIYLRLGPTSEWDTAAGHAILLSAGGHMTQIDGSPFVYGKKNIINPSFVALGRQSTLIEF